MITSESLGRILDDISLPSGWKLRHMEMETGSLSKLRSGHATQTHRSTPKNNDAANGTCPNTHP